MRIWIYNSIIELRDATLNVQVLRFVLMYAILILLRIFMCLTLETELIQYPLNSFIYLINSDLHDLGSD